MNSRAWLRGFGLALLAAWLFGGAACFYVHFTSVALGAHAGSIHALIQRWLG